MTLPRVAPPAFKASRSPRGTAEAPLPPLSRLRSLRTPLDPGELLKREPAMVGRLRADYDLLCDEPRSLTISSWPQIVADTLERIGARCFGGANPSTGLPNRAGVGPLATAAISIGLSYLRNDPGIRLAIEVGQRVGRADGGTRATRALLMSFWRSLDASVGSAPGGSRRSLWLGGSTTSDVSTLAAAVGATPTAVASASACIALAAEPTASFEERSEMARAAASFIDSVRIKATATAALLEVLA